MKSTTYPGSVRYVWHMRHDCCYEVNRHLNPHILQPDIRLTPNYRQRDTAMRNASTTNSRNVSQRWTSSGRQRADRGATDSAPGVMEFMYISLEYKGFKRQSRIWTSIFDVKYRRSLRTSHQPPIPVASTDCRASFTGKELTPPKLT